MSNLGYQCDAISVKTGKRCKKKNTWEFPCTAIYDARVTSYRADKFKSVRLCSCHHYLLCDMRKEGDRLKLHHGGWFGGFNKYNYGNLVTDKQDINWDNPKLRVPKFWSKNDN